MGLYESLVRPLLFRLDADTAHDLARSALGAPLPWRAIASPPPATSTLATNLGGLQLRNPIGLAPGFDKSGAMVPALVQLGFGYVSVGSITALPRAGNPKPRLHRYPARQSLSNCMGMPNPGVEAAIRLLRRPRASGCPVIVGVAGATTGEILADAASLEPFVDAIEVGLVCRHTPETFEMAELPTVAGLVAGIARQKTRPTFLKIPPHHTDAERRRSLAIVDLCVDAGIEGVSVSGTRQIDEPALSQGRGGIAGRATTDDALRNLSDVADRAAGPLAIKAAGGVFTGADARRFLSAGATTVEVYSAFVYRGPRAAAHIVRELAAVLRAEPASPGDGTATARAA
jgi:dihydroorotate dehydrogenase